MTACCAFHQWCVDHARDPYVLEWLSRNPPPAGWVGKPMEWAATEMPYWPTVLWYRLTRVVTP
jgi:hypothetical protein